MDINNLNEETTSQTVVVSAYDKDGKAEACTLAFYMVSSHMRA